MAKRKVPQKSPLQISFACALLLLEILRECELTNGPSKFNVKSLEYGRLAIDFSLPSVLFIRCAMSLNEISSRSESEGFATNQSIAKATD